MLNNIKSDQIFSYTKISDEELITLIRAGKTEARDVLAVRMYRLKDTLTDRVCSDLSHFLNTYELNEAFFLAYLSAEKNYKEERGTKFLTYLCDAYRNQAIAFAKKAALENFTYWGMSLDQEIPYDDNEVSLHEVIYDGRPNEVTTQFGEEDIFDLLERSPIPFPLFHRSLITKLSEGYSLPQAAKALGISCHKARETLKQIKAYLSEVLYRTEKE